jgi:septum formation inhibitor-activating ATPase MinD
MEVCFSESLKNNCNNEVDNDNDNNNFKISILELNSIRDSIESMSKFNQIEVLKILSSNKEVILNENKYGIHINLSDLKEEVIENLKNFINYVNTQEQTLNQVEKQKESFKNTYFAKE